MKMSLFSAVESWYVSRISEYVIPPATKMRMRSRLLLVAAPGFGALCQTGFALRKDVAGVGAALTAGAGIAEGASFTYGNKEASNLLAT